MLIFFVFFAVLVFQSTPSARRATVPSLIQLLESVDFNPRPPRGERPPRITLRCRPIIISIHALREESDQGYC